MSFPSRPARGFIPSEIVLRLTTLCRNDSRAECRSSALNGRPKRSITTTTHPSIAFSTLQPDPSRLEHSRRSTRQREISRNLSCGSSSPRSRASCIRSTALKPTGFLRSSWERLHRRPQNSCAWLRKRLEEQLRSRRGLRDSKLVQRRFSLYDGESHLALFVTRRDEIRNRVFLSESIERIFHGGTV